MAMPKTSAEIVAEMGANPSSPAKRQAALNKILTDNRHDMRLASTKVAQGVVGPIIMRLRYEGIVRSVLMEDPLPQGAGLFYDITTEFGAAYKLQPHDNEVKIAQYEGNRVRYEVIRIAAFPQIAEEDIYKLAINMVDYAKGEAEQRIMEQEDGYLFSSLDAAVSRSPPKTRTGRASPRMWPRSPARSTPARSTMPRRSPSRTACSPTASS